MLTEGFYVQTRYPTHPVESVRNEWVVLAQNSGPMTEEEAWGLKKSLSEDGTEEIRVIEVRVCEREEQARKQNYVEHRLASKGEPRGVWRHEDDDSPCVSYPDSFNWTYYPALTHVCSNHGRNMVCHPYEKVKG